MKTEYNTVFNQQLAAAEGFLAAEWREQCRLRMSMVM